MMLRLFLCLCLLPFFANAQDVQHKIFDGKATVKLPAQYNHSTSDISVQAPKQYRYSATYRNAHKHHSVKVYFDKGKRTAEQMKKEYEDYKASYNTEYLEVLRDEFVTTNDKATYHLEYRLKPAYYSNEKGSLEMSDGRLYPNHFMFYGNLQNGHARTVVTEYGGSGDEIQAIREMNSSIINGYKVL
jgi:hypothetical protein